MGGPSLPELLHSVSDLFAEMEARCASLVAENERLTAEFGSTGTGLVGDSVLDRPSLVKSLQAEPAHLTEPPPPMGSSSCLLSPEVDPAHLTEPPPLGAASYELKPGLGLRARDGARTSSRPVAAYDSEDIGRKRKVSFHEETLYDTEEDHDEDASTRRIASSSAQLVTTTGSSRGASGFVLRPMWTVAALQELHLDHPSAGGGGEDPGVLTHELNEALVKAMLSETDGPDITASTFFRRMSMRPPRPPLEKRVTLLNRLSRKTFLDPQGRARMLWDIISLLLVSYDLAVTPINALVADQGERSVPVLDIIDNSLWTLDIFMSFRTGFYRRGKLVKNSMAIACQYARTWMFFDILVVGAEWVALTTDTVSDIRGVNSGVARITRLMRMVRLIRLAKMQMLFPKLMVGITSMTVFMVMKVAMWVVGIFALMHIVACIWYKVGSGDDGWTSVYSVSESSLAERYVVSLHWAVCQLQGNSDVRPVTLQEQIFHAVVALTCAVVTAIFCSTTTNMMQSDEYFRLEYHRRSVQRFLSKHHVERGMAAKVKQLALENHAIREIKKEEEEVKDLLPSDMVKDIMLKARGCQLADGTPIFRFLMDFSSPYVRRLCCEALEQEHLYEGTIIFIPGDACTQVRWLENGHGKYEREPPNTVDMRPTKSMVEGSHLEVLAVNPGACISEAALFAKWSHVGRLSCLSDGSWLELNVSRFADVTIMYPQVHYLVGRYAQRIIFYMNEVGPSDIATRIPAWVWTAETFASQITERDAYVPLPFQDDLPAHISRHVCTACVTIAQRIAVGGLDERRPHHGFVIVIGDPVALETAGKAGFNPFKGNDVRVVDALGCLNEASFDLMRRNAFNTDGAIVVDGRTGQVVASGWFVGNIDQGGVSGGARTRASKAVAQQAGGCYVIKCSEDSTKALWLHLGTACREFSGKLQLEEAGGLDVRASFYERSM